MIRRNWQWPKKVDTPDSVSALSLFVLKQDVPNAESPPDGTQKPWYGKVPSSKRTRGTACLVENLVFVTLCRLCFVLSAISRSISNS